MIHQFTFENYKAFKNEATLDFIAENISEHKESLIKTKNSEESYVPVIAIYGPNGGGKSTVLEAIIDLRNVLIKYIIMTKASGNEEYERIIQRESLTLKETYYKLLPEYKNLPTKFDIMFQIEQEKYRYQLSLQKDKITEENLYKQNLLSGDVELIFERAEEECTLGEEVENIPVEKVSDKMPLLAHIAVNYDIETVDKIISWFLNIEILDYNNPRSEKRLVLPKTDEKRKLIFEMLSEMDIPIKDIRIEKDEDGNIRNIYTKHLMENGEYCEIKLEEESSGTRKLLSCLARINQCLEEGKLLIADELDAKLHPKLLRYIIELFTNPDKNKNGAQLLFTSHDISTMNKEVFRRDEIWFCAKNPYGASNLYSLVSFKKDNGKHIRNDEAYGKRYLEGRYGADPYIKQIIMWEDSDESEAKKTQ